MRGTNGKKALHVATFSGWYRFEQNGKEFNQTKRDLSYWTLTCMSIDPEDPNKIYAGTEHSGMFYTTDAGAHWHRADPQVPKMFLYSVLALDGGVMVGTVPSAVYRSKNSGWEELAGVRLHSAGAKFPPCDAIERVPPVPPDRRRPEGSIVAGLTALDGVAAFAPAINLLDISGDPAGLLRDLGDVFVDLFRANARDELTAIVFVHGVTSLGACANILPCLDDAAARAGIRYAWQTGCALLSVYGTGAVRPAVTPRSGDDVETAIDRAVAHGDEHVIKFTEACLRTGATRARLAAAAQARALLKPR